MTLASRPGTADSNAPRLPGSLQTNRRLSQWLRFLPDNSIEVHPGKVEIGQGIVTALAQIAAEELDPAIGRIRMVAATTAGSPDENVTSGSRSIQDCGSALRYACAEARAIYLEAAAARLGRARRSLTITDGEIVGANGARSSYGALADDALLEREATAGVPPKDVSRHRIVGTPLQRLDLAQKIYGLPRFVHDLELPGMLHARVLRPPSPAAVLVALDDARARALPGVVAVLRDGSFVGVLAEREETALKALETLRQGASWQETQTLPDAAALGDWLKAQAAESQVIAEAVRTPRPARPRPGVRATPAPISPTPRSRPCARWRNGMPGACTSGATARASTICAPISRWRSHCLRRASSSSMSKVPAATATTAPTMSPTMRPCWRAPPRGCPRPNKSVSGHGCEQSQAVRRGHEPGGVRQQRHHAWPNWFSGENRRILRKAGFIPLTQPRRNGAVQSSNREFLVGAEQSQNVFLSER